MQLPQQLLVGPAQPLLLLRLLLHVLLEVGILLRQLSARGQEEASESGGLSSRRRATGHGRRRPPLRGVRDKAGRRHTRPRPNRDRRLSPGPPAHTECTLIPLPGWGGAGRPVHTAKARGRGRKWRGSWCGGPRGARRQWRVPPRHTRCYLASPSWAVPSPAMDAGLSSAHLLAREPERTGTRGGRFAPAAPSLAPGSGLVDGVTARWPTEPHALPSSVLPAGGRCLHILPWKWGDLRAGERDGIGATEKQLPLATRLLSGTFQPCGPPFPAAPGRSRMTALQPAPLRVCATERAGCGAGPPWPGHSQLAPRPETPSRGEPLQPPAASVASAPRFWGSFQLRGAGPWGAGTDSEPSSPRAEALCGRHVPREPRRPGPPPRDDGVLVDPRLEVFVPLLEDLDLLLQEQVLLRL